jgi:hypothetical protein
LIVVAVAIAGEMVLFSVTTAYSFLGGRNADSFNLRPNDLVNHEAFLWARSLGKVRYVLAGGVDPYDSVPRFQAALRTAGYRSVPGRQKSSRHRSVETLVKLRESWRGVHVDRVRGAFSLRIGLEGVGQQRWPAEYEENVRMPSSGAPLGVEQPLGAVAQGIRAEGPDHFATKTLRIGTWAAFPRRSSAVLIARYTERDCRDRTGRRRHNVAETDPSTPGDHRAFRSTWPPNTRSRRPSCVDGVLDPDLASGPQKPWRSDPSLPPVRDKGQLGAADETGKLREGHERNRLLELEAVVGHM